MLYYNSIFSKLRITVSIIWVNKEEERVRKRKIGLVGFYGISTIVGYLMTNPVYVPDVGIKYIDDL